MVRVLVSRLPAVLVVGVGVAGMASGLPAQAADCFITCREADGSEAPPHTVRAADCLTCQQVARLECSFGVVSVLCFAPVSGRTPPGYACGDPQVTIATFATPPTVCGDFCYDVENLGECPVNVRCHYGDAGRGNPVNVFPGAIPAGKKARVCCPVTAPGFPRNPFQGVFASCPAHVEDECTFTYASIPANECPQEKGAAKIGAGRLNISNPQDSSHCSYPACGCSVGAKAGVCADYICTALTSFGKKGLQGDTLTRCLCTAGETAPNKINLGNFSCAR